MKPKFLLPALFLFIGLTSCSIDDDNGANNSVEARLLGRWVLEGHTINDVYVEGPEQGEEEEILEFRVGGVIVGHSWGTAVTGNYTLSENQIALNFPNGGDIFTLKTLNTTTLELFNEEDFDEEEGVDDVVYHFKKLPN